MTHTDPSEIDPASWAEVQTDAGTKEPVPNWVTDDEEYDEEPREYDDE